MSRRSQHRQDATKAPGGRYADLVRGNWTRPFFYAVTGLALVAVVAPEAVVMAVSADTAPSETRVVEQTVVVREAPEPTKPPKVTKRRTQPPVEEKPAPVVPEPPAAPKVTEPPVTEPPASELIERAETEAQLLAAGDETGGPFSFGLTEFNILGSNHTRPGSNADHFAPGGIRTEWAANLIQERSMDVVGFSEIQRDQLAVFMRATQNQFDAWPGNALTAGAVPQTLVWRKSMFTAVEKRTVVIPFMGQQRPQPYVRLKHNETGREFWVMNVHNAPRTRDAERQRALNIEIPVLAQLRATGLPVFFMGDMNEKTDVFCQVTGRTDLYTPLGGQNNGSCNPPKGMRVDWVFGSPDVRFDSFVMEKSATIRRITDHHVLISRVTIP